jgi:hypothetical protein
MVDEHLKLIMEKKSYESSLESRIQSLNEKADIELKKIQEKTVKMK